MIWHVHNVVADIIVHWVIVNAVSTIIARI
jgi:hypothetical protein